MTKRLTLCALVLLVFAAFAPAAQAFHNPAQNVWYYCDYYQNGQHLPGKSGLFRFQFVYQNTTTLKRGIETFSLNNGTFDNRKVTFAKPVNVLGGYGTLWEFTINPSGPQCKATLVTNYGRNIVFEDCTDGHRRECTL